MECLQTRCLIAEVASLMKTPYLMDSPHWRIDGASDFPRIFLAMIDLFPPGSVIGLSGGSLSAEVRTFFERNRLKLHSDVTPSLPEGEFVDAHYLPLDRQCMMKLAAIAEHHAEPEIANSMVVISNGASVLEWYDAPDDPISISLDYAEDAVSLFARAVGGLYVADKGV